MTYDEIVSIGWEGVTPNKGKPTQKFIIKEDEGKWMMSVFMNPDEEDEYKHDVYIVWVDKKVTHNDWENSDTSFNGFVKNKKELDIISQLVGAIKYNSDKI